MSTAATADYAATVPWGGILNKPAWVDQAPAPFPPFPGEATTTAAGLLPKLSGLALTFLNGNGKFVSLESYIQSLSPGGSSTGLTPTGVTPGPYTNTNLTVDAYGRITLAASGVGAGVAWGTITGTLSSQADLNTALGLKVPTSRTVNGHALSGNIALVKADVGLGAVENTALSTWAGTTNVTTLGTIATGLWHGTQVADAYIASATNWNSKEPALGNPGVSGYVLSSTNTGTRTWVAMSGGGGGAVNWGAILGTLSAQTDLNSALSVKEPAISAGTTAQYWRGDKSWQAISGLSLAASQITSGTLSDSRLSNTAVTPGSYTAANITVDAHGRLTAAANGLAGGSVYNVAVTTANGVSASVANPTTSPNLTFTLGDISAATSKPSATGGVARSFANREGDVFNVRDYGAAGLGVGYDDTAAINAAIAAAAATTNGGTVYFPAGKYYTLRLQKTSNVPLVFAGDGECSSIQCYDTVGALELTSGADYASFEVRDLKFEALNNGPCMKFVCAPAAATHSKNMVKVRGVTLNGGGGHWTTGLDLSYASNALVSDCIFDSGVGDNTGGNVAVKFSQLSVNSMFTDCNFNMWQFGMKCETHQEGLSVAGCSFIYVQCGIYLSVASSALRSAALLVNNCNFDARPGTTSNGLSASDAIDIWCNNVLGVQLVNNYFIGQSTCAKLVQVFNASVVGNQFFIAGNYGVTLENSSPSVNDVHGNPIGCVAVTIVGNNFVGGANSVTLANLCSSCVVQNNVRGLGNTPADMTVVTLNNSDATGGTRGNVVQA